MRSMSGVRAMFKYKVAMWIPLLLFIQLHVYYCCSYSLRQQPSYTTPESRLASRRRVLQCAAAAAYKNSSHNWKSRRWVNVYASIIHRISLEIRRRVLSMMQREEQLHSDAYFHRHALELRLRQQRPQRQLLPIAASPPLSLTNTGPANPAQRLSFKYSEEHQQLAKHPKADEQVGAMLLPEPAEVQKKNVEDQKRFVPAGPNPLHNRRR